MKYRVHSRVYRNHDFSILLQHLEKYVKWYKNTSAKNGVRKIDGNSSRFVPIDCDLGKNCAYSILNLGNETCVLQFSQHHATCSL